MEKKKKKRRRKRNLNGNDYSINVCHVSVFG